MQASRVFARAFSTTPIKKLPLSLGKLNHIAIACPDLKKSAEFYKNTMGATVSEPVAQPEHGVYTVFVNLPNSKIELLGALGDKSPIAKFLAKNQDGGIHHMCIEVADINKAISAVKSKKIRCLSEKPTIGAHGKPVVFLHPKDCNGVLIELEQV